MTVVKDAGFAGISTSSCLNEIFFSLKNKEMVEAVKVLVSASRVIDVTYFFVKEWINNGDPKKKKEKNPPIKVWKTTPPICENFSQMTGWTARIRQDVNKENLLIDRRKRRELGSLAASVSAGIRFWFLAASVWVNLDEVEKDTSFTILWMEYCLCRRIPQSRNAWRGV